MGTFLKIRYGVLLILMSLYLNSSDAACSSKNVFGPNCEFLCHCMNNEQCNRSTGNCPSGCDFDWVGPGCQRRNVVPVGESENRIVVRHQSNNPQECFALFAVDRNLSTCSSTNYANISRSIPWWRLWFRNQHKIRKISILTAKEYLDYFKNLKVTVENSTFNNRYSNIYSGRKICYIHDGTAPRTTTFTITCNRTIYGNQIKIRLATNGTQLVLCDVRIYGECDDGTFGVSCTDRCSTHCQDICDKDNGTCTLCNSGWTGNRCNQECDDGKYGEDCKLDCSGNCKNEAICRRTDGVCVDGCNPGYEGVKCDRTCDDGKYGRNCVFNCSGNCGNNSCSKVDGSCEQGCKTGYTGNRCNESCGIGYYGDKCAQHCSDNCFKNTCNSGNGNCFQGCKPGWVGLQCEQECQDGFYGANCTLNCGKHCLNGTLCINTNGTCTNGCDPGWTGDTCKDVCVDGYYGHECMQKCSINCVGGYLNCDNVFGSCMSGCIAGWMGRKCDEVCPIGRWGINCANACGDCTSGNCRHTDGVCDGGCAAGVQNTPHCDEECNDGSFGMNCSGVCSNNCKDVCRKQTGECKYCKSGWHGAKCTLECEDGSWGENCKRTCLTCRNETCNRINGACYSQCKPGFKQTEYCDQECSSGWYGLNCSEECNRNCKDVTFCRKTDGSCIECKPGLEGKICDKAIKQKETMVHISGGGIAAVVVTFIVLIFFSVVVTVFISRKRLHINHNRFENETVSYSNVLGAETSASVLKTPESNLNVEMENVYDILKRTSGIEHTYE